MNKPLDRWSSSEIAFRRFAIGSGYDSSEWCKSEEVAKLEAEHAQLQAKYEQLVETLRLVTTNMKHTTQPVWDAQKDEWDMTYEYRLPTVIGRQVFEVYDRIFIQEFRP